ncbi:MAG TPA: NUDIX domain-containing protein [Candidatus Binatia bacterium]|nr:NUDIX domain-containing protein [Candidatus Binatia bacterium]
MKLNVLEHASPQDAALEESRATTPVLDYIGALRRMIGNTKIIIPGVRALLLNDRGELLLEEQRLFGSWALPHGCVDLGESALQALTREVHEETGLDVLRARAFGIYTDPKYSVTYPNGDQVQTFTIAFVVDEWRGTLRPDGDEVRALGFFALDALPSPIYPIHAETIDDFRAADGTFVLK